MRLFTRLYDWMIRLSRHRRAPVYLGGLSFAESSFFPIPPDVMLIPMSLAQPRRAYRFALITTVTSVLGGIFGYLIGIFGFQLISPLISKFGYVEQYQLTQQWFDDWGVWAIFLAGFSPVPYKIFTISAGVISMAFVPFVIASFIGRGMRFFLVSGLIAWGGDAMEAKIRNNVDIIGWIAVALVITLILLLKGS